MALTSQQKRYVEARLSGMGKRAAAIAAGAPEKGAAVTANRYEKDPEIIGAMSRKVALAKEAAKTVTPVEPVEQSAPTPVSPMPELRGQSALPPLDPNPNMIAAGDDALEFLKSVWQDRGEEMDIRLKAGKSGRFGLRKGHLQSVT
jgi:phage terminase small subunit